MLRGIRRLSPLMALCFRQIWHIYSRTFADSARHHVPCYLAAAHLPDTTAPCIIASYTLRISESLLARANYETFTLTSCAQKMPLDCPPRAARSPDYAVFYQLLEPGGNSPAHCCAQRFSSGSLLVAATLNKESRECTRDARMCLFQAHWHD